MVLATADEEPPNAPDPAAGTKRGRGWALKPKVATKRLKRETSPSDPEKPEASKDDDDQEAEEPAEKDAVAAVNGAQALASLLEASSTTLDFPKGSAIAAAAATTKRHSFFSPTSFAPTSPVSPKMAFNIAGVNIAAYLAESTDPPPVFSRGNKTRRNRRRKHLTAEHALFAQHSRLRENLQTYARLFQEAPLSTDEDVLRSLVEFTDAPAAVYAELLWKYTPEAVATVAMLRSLQRCGHGAPGAPRGAAAKGEPAAAIVKLEENCPHSDAQ